MQPCSVFSKSPINVLSYFHNLKSKKERNKKKTEVLKESGTAK